MTRYSLDEFISSRIGNPKVFPRNQYVSHPGWESLYVRCTSRLLDGKTWSPVIDLANIQAETPGNGAFGELVDHLQETYPEAVIYVEQVLPDRFMQGLLRMGFKQKGEERSFYLLPKICEACNGNGVVEISRSGHPLDPDAREVPCPECQEIDEPDPDSKWDSRCDKEF